MIRLAKPRDLAALTALTLRSKAHWGYDAAFMEAVRDELTFTEEALGPGLALWEEYGRPRGVVQVSVRGKMARLEDLFVDPDAMGRGIGRALTRWAMDRAQAHGALRMQLAADPYAEDFYRHLGAHRIGEEASGSIPGRKLPLMEFELSAAAAGTW